MQDSISTTLKNSLDKIEEVLADSKLAVDLEYDQTILLLDMLVSNLIVDINNNVEVERYIKFISSINNIYKEYNTTSRWEGNHKATLENDRMAKRLTETPQATTKFQALRQEALQKYHPDLYEIYTQLKTLYIV